MIQRRQYREKTITISFKPNRSACNEKSYYKLALNNVLTIVPVMKCVKTHFITGTTVKKLFLLINN